MSEGGGGLGQRRPLGSTCHCEPIASAAFVVVSLARAGADEEARLASAEKEGEEFCRTHYYVYPVSQSVVVRPLGVYDIHRTVFVVNTEVCMKDT